MPPETTGRAIFISYRRDDAEGEAGRLFDDLVRAFDEKSVFMDVAGIQPGSDFRKAIDQNVASCGVLLAIVGPHWASITDAQGNHRLENDNDFVRLEIASALTRNVPVIPVLVHEAKMPSADVLPENLKDFSYRNSVELTHARWNSDVALLVEALRSYVHVAKEHETEPIHATVPVQLPPPQPPQPDESASAKSRTPLFAGIAVAVLLAVGAGVFAATHHSQQPAQTAPSPVPAPAPVTPPAPESAALTPFIGRWQNTAQLTPKDSLLRLVVSNGGSQMLVHAYGKCEAGPCDWGTQPAIVDGSKAVTSAYQLRNNPQEVQLERSATLTLEPSADGLGVTITNSYQDAGTHPPGKALTYTFARATGS
ncbi:toll/interleukin-1 receptor domain-containing protein [Granulicella sibirica]|uniref:TIR domain-containing protein n=1 Tax=Granulicella sibirica TaxID=2479048 RepID=A0A4Q0T0A3_9BACT|nr:toll/interleukin-1 receptor domain-containing protein [Granulicella sibirica]RXH56132.1 hypothetical protein GRAN_2989 [Granulicella sibirica]